MEGGRERARARGGAGGATAPRPPWRGLTGRVLDGYRVEACVRAGKGAVIYKATRLSGGEAPLSLFRRVALKVLRWRPGEGDDAVAGFRREVRAQAAIDHAHVIRVLGAAERAKEALYYLAMPFVPGPTLAQVVRARGRVAAPFVVHVGRAVASALAALAERAIVHCDVQPKNILINDRTLRPYLTDFGLARTGDGRDALTARGLVAGTPLYMSPEQVLGHPVLTPASDVYALGASLYHAATGRPLFAGSTAEEVMRAHVRADAPDPREHAPGLPQPIAALLRACVAKDPGRRPTPAEVARRLDAIRSAEGWTGGRRQPAPAPSSGRRGAPRWRPASPVPRAIAGEVAAPRPTRLALSSRAVIALRPAAEGLRAYGSR